MIHSSTLIELAVAKFLAAIKFLGTSCGLASFVGFLGLFRVESSSQEDHGAWAVRVE